MSLTKLQDKMSLIKIVTLFIMIINNKIIENNCKKE